jgi:hypothetical protein
MVELAGPRSDYIIIVYDSETAASNDPFASQHF